MAVVCLFCAPVGVGLSFISEFLFAVLSRQLVQHVPTV